MLELLLAALAGPVQAAPVPAAETRAMSEAETLSVIRARLVLTSPPLVVVYVRNDGADPVRVTAMTVAGAGTGSEPVVSLVSRTNRRVSADRIVPPQSSLAAGEVVVIEGRVPEQDDAYEQQIPATIEFEGGRVLEARLTIAVPISHTPPSERIPTTIPPGRRN